MRLSSWLKRLALAFRSSSRVQASPRLRRKLRRDVATLSEFLETRTLLSAISWDGVAISGNDLIISDAGNVTNDTVTVSTDGTNVTINDPNKTFAMAISGATGNGTNTIVVPLSAFTGAIIVDGGDGNDSLTINLGSGNFGRAITFNGGGQTTGDSLTVTGGGTFASVAHNFTNANDGSISVTGNSTVSYTGLEPVFDNLSATDRVFTFNGGAETITVTDGTAADGKTNIDSTLSESVYFVNPTGSTTINAGGGNDIVTITSVDAAFTASLTINGDAGNDTINLNADITFATNKNLDLDLTNDATGGDVDAILVGANANLILAGTGTATLKASKNIALASGSSVVTVNGALTLSANAGATGTGNFTGIDVNGGLVQSTGTGNVTVTGRGGTAGTTQKGVHVRGGGDIIGGTSGTVSVTGTGGTGSANRIDGVMVEGAGATITSGGANVQVTGTGGAGGAGFENNIGVTVLNGGVITAGALELSRCSGPGEPYPVPVMGFFPKGPGV